MNDNFIPSKNANQLSIKCAAALRANADVMGLLLLDLPKSKHEALKMLLAGGGKVGIETMIDGKAINTISLVAIEREGSRLVLGTVGIGEPASSGMT